LSFWSAITREERSKRLASNTSLAAGFSRQLWRYGVPGIHAGTCGANALPAAGFPCQLWRDGVFGVHAGTDKRLILGESTGRMSVQGNVWLLLPSVADYPALFECTKENCLFSVWEGERGLKGEGGNPALNGVASLSLIRKGVFLWNKHSCNPAGTAALC